MRNTCGMTKIKKVTIILLAMLMMLSISIPVHAAKTSVKFRKNYTVGVDTRKQIRFPWDGVREYRFRIENTKILKLADPTDSGDYYAGEHMYQTFEGIKSGKTKVTVRSKKKKIGSFYITVKKLTPKMKKSTYKLTYSPYGPTEKSTLLAVDLYDGQLKNYNKKAKYKLKSSNKKVAKVSGGTVTACGTGKAKISVYETLNGKTRKVCTFKVECKKTKMSKVAEYNRSLFDDGLFGRGDMVEFLSVNGDEMDAQLFMYGTIRNGLLTRKGTKFKKRDYKITYVSSDPSIVTVDGQGVVTAHKEGAADVEYRITFSDGSVFAEKVAIEVY